MATIGEIKWNAKVNREYKKAVAYFKKRNDILYKEDVTGDEVLVKVIVKLYKNIAFSRI